MLVITVPTFEEQIDASGNLVTYYVVNVEDTKTSYKYKLIKRYSAFANLWETLKDKYPGVSFINIGSTCCDQFDMNASLPRWVLSQSIYLKIILFPIDGVI